YVQDAVEVGKMGRARRGAGEVDEIVVRRPHACWRDAGVSQALEVVAVIRLAVASRGIYRVPGLLTGLSDARHVLGDVQRRFVAVFRILTPGKNAAGLCGSQFPDGEPELGG